MNDKPVELSEANLNRESRKARLLATLSVSDPKLHKKGMHENGHF
jgi:hypothetical protein